MGNVPSGCNGEHDTVEDGYRDEAPHTDGHSQYHKPSPVNQHYRKSPRKYKTSSAELIDVTDLSSPSLSKDSNVIVNSTKNCNGSVATRTSETKNNAPSADDPILERRSLNSIPTHSNASHFDPIMERRSPMLVLNASKQQDAVTSTRSPEPSEVSKSTKDSQMSINTGSQGSTRVSSKESSQSAHENNIPDTREFISPQIYAERGVETVMLFSSGTQEYTMSGSYDTESKTSYINTNNGLTSIFRPKVSSTNYQTEANSTIETATHEEISMKSREFPPYPNQLSDTDERSAMTDMAHDGDDESTVIRRRDGLRASTVPNTASNAIESKSIDRIAHGGGSFVSLTPAAKEYVEVIDADTEYLKSTEMTRSEVHDVEDHQTFLSENSYVSRKVGGSVISRRTSDHMDINPQIIDVESSSKEKNIGGKGDEVSVTNISIENSVTSRMNTKSVNTCISEDHLGHTTPGMVEGLLEDNSVHAEQHEDEIHLREHTYQGIEEPFSFENSVMKAVGSVVNSIGSYIPYPQVGVNATDMIAEPPVETIEIPEPPVATLEKTLTPLENTLNPSVQTDVLQPKNAPHFYDNVSSKEKNLNEPFETADCKDDVESSKNEEAERKVDEMPVIAGIIGDDVEMNPDRSNAENDDQNYSVGRSVIAGSHIVEGTDVVSMVSKDTYGSNLIVTVVATGIENVKSNSWVVHGSEVEEAYSVKSYPIPHTSRQQMIQRSLTSSPQIENTTRFQPTVVVKPIKDVQSICSHKSTAKPITDEQSTSSRSYISMQSKKSTQNAIIQALQSRPSTASTTNMSQGGDNERGAHINEKVQQGLGTEYMGVHESSKTILDKLSADPDDELDAVAKVSNDIQDGQSICNELDMTSSVGLTRPNEKIETVLESTSKQRSLSGEKLKDLSCDSPFLHDKASKSDIKLEPCGSKINDFETRSTGCCLEIMPVFQKDSCDQANLDENARASSTVVSLIQTDENHGEEFSNDVKRSTVDEYSADARGSTIFENTNVQSLLQLDSPLNEQQPSIDIKQNSEQEKNSRSSLQQDSLTQTDATENAELESSEKYTLNGDESNPVALETKCEVDQDEHFKNPIYEVVDCFSDKEEINVTSSALDTEEYAAAISPTATNAGLDLEGVDLNFVEQYEETFNSFLEKHPHFFTENRGFVEIMQIAKLQKILGATADAEAELLDQVAALEMKKKETTKYYQNRLLEATKKKAVREVQLQNELNTIQQATKLMESKLTWQIISKSESRAKKYVQILEYLDTKKKIDANNPLDIMPDTTETKAIRDTIQSFINKEPTQQQEKLTAQRSSTKDIQQLQIDNAFLNAEALILERKLLYVQQSAKQYTWIDSVFRRLTSKQHKLLKHKYQQSQQQQQQQQQQEQQDEQEYPMSK